jgi:hypothetical protein
MPIRDCEPYVEEGRELRRSLVGATENERALAERFG